jgi:hypothetical protein
MYMKKEKKLIQTLTIRISENELNNYRIFCENKDYSISKRLRHLIRLDIDGKII